MFIKAFSVSSGSLPCLVSLPALATPAAGGTAPQAPMEKKCSNNRNQHNTTQKILQNLVHVLFASLAG
jgi:hypothetical protein